MLGSWCLYVCGVGRPGLHEVLTPKEVGFGFRESGDPEDDTIRQLGATETP